MLLADKTAVISGAASPRGIGLATARLFAQARRAGRHPRPRRGRRAARGGGARRGPSSASPATSPTARAASARPRQVLDAFGKLDILINNAGITQPVKIDGDHAAGLAADRRRQHDAACSTSARPSSRTCASASRARIACMSSVSAQRGGGIFGGPHYSAAKAGVLGLAKAMARELGPDGIRVNCVTPGLIQTDITGGKLTDEMRAEILQGHPAEPARRRRGRGEHLPVPGLRPVRLRHRRGDRRQRRHADPLSAAAATAPSTRQQSRRRAMEAHTTLANAPSLEERAYRIRRNALRMGEVQGQGYIAQALGVADVLAVAYFHALRYRPEDPEWEGRDRFLLSIGHYAIALYAALIEAGIIPRGRARDLRQRRQPPADVGHGRATRRAWRSAAARSGTGSASRSASALGLKRKGSDALRLQPDVGRRAGRGRDLGRRRCRPAHWKLDNLICHRRRQQPAGRRPVDRRAELRAAGAEVGGVRLARAARRRQRHRRRWCRPSTRRARCAEPKPRVIICDTQDGQGRAVPRGAREATTSSASSRTNGSRRSRRSTPGGRMSARSTATRRGGNSRRARPGPASRA